MAKKQDKQEELLQGTLDLLLLKTVARGAMHGYAIAEHIREVTDEVLRVEEGALYPALHRLELRGLLQAEWGVSENNRRAKYYRLTTAGKRQLVAETEYWGSMTLAIGKVLRAT